VSNPNGARGARAERDLVVWLRANGYPDAVRARGEGSVDRGDIGGIPRTAIQVKNANKPEYVMARLRAAQAGALEQAHNRRPVAVVRLPGVTDPAQWWAATPTLHQPGLCPVDHPLVLDRCSVHTLRNVLSWRGGAVRAGWWITTCERLFGALPGAVTS
jgi:hypothetical protein